MSDDGSGQVPGSVDEEAPDGIAALTDDVVPALIARLRASRLGELEVRSGSWRVRLRRDASARLHAPVGVPSAGEEASEAVPQSSIARSTAVGYFTPGPQLVLGAFVHAGDVLGTVDVLGITQEVTAPSDGIVARVLAEDGQAVEYGQALADIDPLEPGFEADAEGPEAR